MLRADRRDSTLVNCESVVAAYQGGTRRSTSLLQPLLRGPIIEDVRSTRETIQSALGQSLIDEDRKPVHVQLLPGLSKDELDVFVLSLPVPPSADIRDLLTFCSGIEGTLEQIDFTGRTLRDGFGAEVLMPHGLAIAHDGVGNHWVVDLQPGTQYWGPIYFCCHDAPVMLLQAATVQQFVSEVFKMYVPPHQSLIDDVHEDRLFDVWRTNPGVMAHSNATASPDPDLQAFAAGLDVDFEILDLRNARVGMGFSWGRYGPKTEVIRFGDQAIFAYRKPEKKNLISRLFRREAAVR